MTRRLPHITIYINPVLAEDYARRRASNSITARYLGGFPLGTGGFEARPDLAALMLEDAHKQAGLEGQRSVLALAYRGLIKQIERRLDAEDLKQINARLGLSLVVQTWVK